ncbi:MAG TPA: WYL domain-containing protein [Acidimicrobiales bacterium]|nr:WYL domain-containing protein [Acidimicrobiales bacterium]
MARPSADERLRRLLAIVPWVAANDGPPVADVCARFGVTEAELLADVDLLQYCGVYPFTADVLMEVRLEGDRIWIQYADWFNRPLRLTPEEALTLVASGRTLLAVPGTDPAGPLARGLSKLAAALGVDADEAIDVHLGNVPAGMLDTLRTAIAAHRRVELDYYTYGRDARTRRVIEPWDVYAAEGEWYVQAWCHAAQAERLFRLDRIRAVSVLDATFDPPAALPPRRVFSAEDAGDRIVLDLEPWARWVAGQYPMESVEELGEGRMRVSMKIAERAWLERLLLRLGPGATVIEGDPGLARAAAARVLERYTGSVNRE